MFNVQRFIMVHYDITTLISYLLIYIIIINLIIIITMNIIKVNRKANYLNVIDDHAYT